LRVLKEKLQNSLRQTDELKVTNRELEAKLQMAGSRERDTIHAKKKVEKCMVVGTQKDSTKDLFAISKEAFQKAFQKAFQIW
jgi:hypothetical protein